MNRKNIKYLAFGLLFAVLAVGSVYAYMYRQSITVENTFVPAQVSCDVEEEFDGSEKSSVTVKNTGNIDAYIRVRMVSYWVDGNNNIVAESSVMPQVEIADGWIADTANYTYYYTQPVTPGALTPELLKSGTTISLTTKDGYKQVVEIFAEAIQALPEDAVKSAWNVEITDKTITEVN